MSQRQQLERLMEMDRQIRSGHYPNARSLAQSLEVSPRVIYQDRKFMVERLGAPITHHRQRGGWYYSEPTWKLPSLMVTEGELLAFVLGTQAVRQAVGTALEAPLLTAVSKIAHNLHGPVQVDLDSLRAYCTFAAPPALAVDHKVLLALLEAARDQRQVSIDYYTAESDVRTRRTVDPYALHQAYGNWYLLAFDHWRQAMRTFHIGRIHRWQCLEQRFVRDPAFDLEQWRRSVFTAETSAEVLAVAIRFDAYQARFIRGRQWHVTQQVEELTDGGLILRFQSSGWGEITRFVLQYGSHAEVLSPPELREEIAGEVARMFGAYGNGGLNSRSHSAPAMSSATNKAVLPGAAEIPTPQEGDISGDKHE
ncbi:MAG: WYL domain-containing transcriptional regulator [Abitibacteriaceae bacterium]|nr:WYL domain-containing transcriptional regulator [Abditibacteriaceae bacterium]